MNTIVRTVTAHTTAAHAEDMGVAAYLAARQLGMSAEQAVAARDSAYGDVMRGTFTVAA